MSNKVYIVSLITPILVSLGVTMSAEAEVIFEDNFDNTPDWQSVKQSGIVYPGGPEGWDAHRDAQDDYGQPGYRVNSDYYRGTAGKALTATYENDGYIAGGGVYKFIAPTDGVSGYDEVYIAWWEKFHTWDWQDSRACFLKMIRILLGIDTSKPDWEMMETIQYYTIIDWRGPQDYPEFMSSTIRNPFIVGVSDPTDDVNHLETYWPGIDGKWHHNEFHIKLNTVGQADGFIEYYQDGVKKWERTNWKFRDTDIKINALIMMDNSINDFETGTENEYSIDDFVVSTTYIGPDYVIGGLTGDVNGDGTVDILDLQLCVNVFLGTETTPEYVQRAKEVAEPKDECNVLDVQAIVNIILGV